MLWYVMIRGCLGKKGIIFHTEINITKCKSDNWNKMIFNRKRINNIWPRNSVLFCIEYSNHSNTFLLTKITYFCCMQSGSVLKKIAMRIYSTILITNNSCECETSALSKFGQLLEHYERLVK